MERVVVFFYSSMFESDTSSLQYAATKMAKNILVSTNDFNYIFTTQSRSDRGYELVSDTASDERMILKVE